MLHFLRRRRQGEREGGFTLIELMVVVLIIAILIAIAIPTFLGARSRAQDRAAQANLRNALVAAKSIYTDSQDYSKAVKISAANDPLKNVEPSLSYQLASAASTGQNEISADSSASPATIWYGSALSASGTCFYIKDDLSTGTQYGSGASTACKGSDAKGLASASWKSKW
jgi:type IV pilus assembly protein PilA